MCEAVSRLSMFWWLQSPSRLRTLRGTTSSSERMVRSRLRGWPWSPMPRSSVVPFLGTTPLGMARNGTQGSEPKISRKPSSCMPAIWLAAAATPPFSAYMESRLGMSTIWCAMFSVFIRTPSPIIESSSRSGQSANSVAANARSMPVRLGSDVGSKSFTWPGPARRSQRRPRAGGLMASTPKATASGRLCLGPPLLCHARQLASQPAMTARAHGSTMSLMSWGHQPSSGGGWAAGSGSGSVG